MKNKPVLENILIDNLDDLAENKFGIKEPDGGTPFKGALDLIIVPGLGFAENGYRIGYGGGYYDHFLANQPKALKIGVGFPIQLMPDLPSDDHDVPMDILIIGNKTLYTKA
jgi:5-formyltetrahydrofolate cyclo-ligase